MIVYGGGNMVSRERISQLKQIIVGPLIYLKSENFNLFAS